MDIFKEPIHYQNPQLCLKVWTFVQSGKHNEESHSWHFHKEVEFLLVLRGEHHIITPSRTYRLEPGAVMVVGSNQLHRGYVGPEHESEYIVLHVDLEAYFDPATISFMGRFMELLYPLDGFNDLFASDLSVRSEAGGIISRIHEEVMRAEAGYELAVSMHMKHLLLVLLRNDRDGVLSSLGPLDAGVLGPVIAYIDARLETRIDMREVSRIAGMSYVYFSKFFKEKLGISFTEYVNRKRIAKAKRLLAISDRQISDIAEAVGYENMAHFYGLFKRYSDCTPKQFKERLNRSTGS
ncbi:AraC family transcriptional regulator [Paenibacillus sp. LHD-117]|uniref:helix-turn-helix transcriptional regulator n=1 Tax=Paenibacillus sp. LHD-117 TaxID=3071412 RepID=UPI0027E200F1|nr:AraC family transcriptional regulator [Paenibacillus sp. LHD-117]MDQ6420655.1 AraC family transcriptional regulator [Paenibacillus sp. LHD-117]